MALMIDLQNIKKMIKYVLKRSTNNVYFVRYKGHLYRFNNKSCLLFENTL